MGFGFSIGAGPNGFDNCMDKEIKYEMDNPESK
jgi:hypothetical protein